MLRPARFVVPLVFLTLVAWVLWLRWPGLSHRVWNLDEAIHSAVAAKLLDGGVLYRDAIDQRTPLSYYVVAAVYAVAGRNNVFALHVVTALVVALTAFLLWQLGRAWRHRGAGAWAAALYATLATTLFYQGDANAFHTEWLLALCTTAAALAFARAMDTRANRWLVVAGGLFGLAFLSKQPALLDAAAPVLALVYLALRRRDERPLISAHLASLVAGWLVPVSLTAGYFAVHSALRDAVYYAWTYNITIYGPEIPVAARLGSALQLWNMFAESAPPVLSALLVAIALIAFRLVQRTARGNEEHDHAFHAYAAAWTLTALAGALSGGRGFEHYFVQTLPPLCLLAGWLFEWVGRVALDPNRRSHARFVAALVLATTLFTLSRDALERRDRPLSPDTSVFASEFIRRVAPASETIFVWGYHPEIYLFSERSSASRFVYASFLTGLVPWTNVSPERDTSYSIVPGAMATLLAELEAKRPMFFIDCSAGPNRFWQKYPLAKFPELKAFVDAHYVRVDPGLFHGQGYDLYLLRDDARRAPLRWPATAHDTPAELAPPGWLGPTAFTNRSTDLLLHGASPNGRLTGLQLLVDGRVVAGVSCAPIDSLKISVPVHFERQNGTNHTIQVRVVGDDGSTLDGPARKVTVAEGRLSETEAAKFSLPQVTSAIRPLFVQTLFGADMAVRDGRPIFFVHAPSTIAFPLPRGAQTIRGGFGFRDGAYAPDNQWATDGAEFRVEIVDPDGRRHPLFARLLQPKDVAADRGVQSFSVDAPATTAPECHLEFVITAGPAENAASDWTFWTDLRIETSR